LRGCTPGNKEEQPEDPVFTPLAAKGFNPYAGQACNSAKGEVGHEIFLRAFSGKIAGSFGSIGRTKTVDKENGNP